MTETTSPNDACAARESCSTCKLANRKILLLGLLVLVAWSAYTLLGGRYSLEGKKAPSFSLPLVEGGTFHLADHLGKTPILLDFWAIWCPPCRASLPKVNDAYRQFKDAGAIICAVNLGDSPESVSDFLKNQSIQMPVALDSEGTAADLYRVSSIPMLVFIDREGMVQHINIGAMEADALKTLFHSLLQ